MCSCGFSLRSASITGELKHSLATLTSSLAGCKGFRPEREVDVVSKIRKGLERYKEAEKVREGRRIPCPLILHG